MPPSLPELQRSFAAAVLDRQAPPAEVCAGAFSATQRLQIYQRNTAVTLTEALAACYPVIQSLVGQEFFAGAADQYLRRHPPRSGNIHNFGADLAQFLLRFAPAQALDYLPDVARLEWARQLSYHAPDAPVLAPASLAGIAPEHYCDLLFELHPATRLIASAYPIFDIWRLHQPDADPQAGVDLSVGGQRVLVRRRRLGVALEAIPPGEYLWLQALAAGQTLAAATELARAADPCFELGPTLQQHVALGTWTRVSPLHHIN